MTMTGSADVHKGRVQWWHPNHLSEPQVLKNDCTVLPPYVAAYGPYLLISMHSDPIHSQVVCYSRTVRTEIFKATVVNAARFVIRGRKI